MSRYGGDGTRYPRTPAEVRGDAGRLPLVVYLHFPACRFPSGNSALNFLRASVCLHEDVARFLVREYGGTVVGPIALADLPRVKFSRARADKRRRRELLERPPFAGLGVVVPP